MIFDGLGQLTYDIRYLTGVTSKTLFEVFEDQSNQEIVYTLEELKHQIILRLMAEEDKS